MLKCSTNSLSIMNKEMLKIKDIIREEKKKGKKVVMTCGCFSLLHPGHVEFLKEGKKLGDILIVGINCDEYISKTKGYKLFFKQEERLGMISELKCVDYCFVFYEDTFENALTTISPTVFIKGPEYKNCVDKGELKVCIKNDIALEFIGEIKKYDASKILNQLKRF